MPPAARQKTPQELLKYQRFKMWQAAANAARAAGRFARRHRRAIVVGGVVGAAACVYHGMKKALKEVKPPAAVPVGKDPFTHRQHAYLCT